MYRIKLRHLREDRGATLLMTGESASQMRCNDVLVLTDGPPEWLVLEIIHSQMTLGSLKILQCSMMRAKDGNDERYAEINRWNRIVVCQELRDLEKKLLIQKGDS